MHHHHERTMLLNLAIACCKLYVSESRSASTLLALHQAATRPPAPATLLHSFPDPLYNRVGFTLAASLHADGSHTGGPPPPPSSPLHDTVLAILKTAFQYVDLRHHSGSHPRLGVVDHICFHPLGVATLSMVASIAHSIASDIGSNFQVPTYLYGAAHHEGRPLDALRKSMGYFRPNIQGHWVGANPIKLTLPPDFGPLQAQPRSGVVVVGASPWVVNYNIPVLSNDLELCRSIARKVSARGGGLPAVQAMALRHGENVVEIACNLLDSKVIGPDLVQEEVIRLAERDGLLVEKGYFTDYSEEEITETALRKLGSEGNMHPACRKTL